MEDFFFDVFFGAAVVALDVVAGTDVSDEIHGRAVFAGLSVVEFSVSKASVVVGFHGSDLSILWGDGSIID